MKYFLTGATGFIGSNLTKSLAKQGAEITVLLNKTTDPDFLQHNQKSIRAVKADLLDSYQLMKEMLGHDVVVHLAYGSRGTPEQQYQITVEGTKSVFKAATNARVKRFIHLSTTSVYGEPPKNIIYTEDTPRYASLGLYPNLKHEAESAVLNLPREPIEVVVLQPTIVYGPGGSYWTEGILKIFQQKTFPLVNKGQGLCNLIHVYDVVDAIILAASAPGIDGNCFIVANDEPVTWAAFLKAYEKIVAQKCLVDIPTQIMKQYNVWQRASSKAWEYKLYTKVLRKLFKIFQFPYIKKPIEFIDNEKIDFFAAQPYFSNQKAKQLLNFEPKRDLEEGMRTVKEWVEKNQILKNST